MPQFMDKLLNKAGLKPEEEKTELEKLQEQMDDCCPKLSYTQVTFLFTLSGIFNPSVRHTTASHRLRHMCWDRVPPDLGVLL